jgi:hypothetical protein
LEEVWHELLADEMKSVSAVEEAPDDELVGDFGPESDEGDGAIHLGVVSQRDYGARVDLGAADFDVDGVHDPVVVEAMGFNVLGEVGDMRWTAYTTVVQSHGERGLDEGFVVGIEGYVCETGDGGVEDGFIGPQSLEDGVVTLRVERIALGERLRLCCTCMR